MNTKSKKRYKDIDFPFTCPLTGRKFESSKGLSVYVTKTLKLNHEEYYDTNINHRDSSCFFCGNKGKFISLSKGYRNLCNNQECVKNNIKTIGGYDSYTPYRPIEEALKNKGFDVLVFVPSMDEEEGLVTCGNLILGGDTLKSNKETVLKIKGI